MKKDNIYWGLLFLIGGIFLIISKLGFLGDVNVFSLVIAILLVGIIIKSVISAHFSGIFFPVAFIAILFDEKLGITAVTPWTVLFAALLLTIGANLLFGKKRFNKFYHKSYVDGNNFCGKQSISTEDEGNIRIDTSFQGCTKYINSKNFERCDVDCSFASLKIYFDNAVMKNENAILNMDVSFGGVEIYVPKGWRVVNNASCSFGAINEKNKINSVITNTLTITGEISFSGVEVFYI